VKRPLALMANYVRIMGYDFTPTEGVFNQLASTGQRLFGWPTPTGLPDDNAFFIGPNAMRNRWNLMNGLANNAWGTGVPDAAKSMVAWGGQLGTGEQTVAAWFHLFGAGDKPDLISSATVAAGLLPFAQPVAGDDKHLATAAAIAAMSPEFQIC
jgi:hypothetical protein